MRSNTSINNEENSYDSDEESTIHAPPRTETASLTTHIVLISLYVILWTSESLVIHSAKDVDYEKASVTLAVEVFKLTVASILYFGYGGGSIKEFVEYANRGSMFFMLGLIYCLYNLLRYYALTISDPGTYRVMINLRVATTGLLYQVFKVGDPLTPRKWSALVLLMLGCAIMKWGELYVTLFPIFIISILAFLGSAGGVYNEKILKKDMNVDINLQNVYLYIFTILFNVLSILLTDPVLLTSPSTLFRNWSSTMLPMIMLGGGGGFMTALMLKRLNVLTKEYANGFEMLSTALLSFYFFGYPDLDIKVFLSILVVTSSIFVFYWEKLPFSQK